MLDQMTPVEVTALAPGVVLAATMDTKSAEVALMREALEGSGLFTILIDCGILGEPRIKPDVSAVDIARLGGGELSELRARRDRPFALETMTRGLKRCLSDLLDRGLVRGYLGMGGGTNTALASAAFAFLPYGIPKLLVATTASGNTTDIVGAKDVTLIHSVVDILGTGSYLRGLIVRSAAVMNALIASSWQESSDLGKSVAGITAFGSTTAAANRMFDLLTDADVDVVTFHARGSGGKAMEDFIRERKIQAVLDLTTTEIADEVVGGTLSAGPGRLDAAVAMGIPQVILPGAIDMVNFGSPETIPAKFAQRTFFRHTPTTTLMRTTADEIAGIARFIARKLARASAPARIIVPLRGFSAYDEEGGPFFDPDADQAFCKVLRKELRSDIPLIEIDAHINDPAVAEFAVQTLLAISSEETKTRQK